MRICISYFYKIRFFEPYMIPFSTAVWDPKWFHFNKGSSYIDVDKNGVVNGIRIPKLVPGKSCENLCKGIDNGLCLVNNSSANPSSCKFLSEYKKQIESINFYELINYINSICNEYKKIFGFKNEPIAVLMVYETPDNKCSERSVLIDVFKNKGFEIEELKI